MEFHKTFTTAQWLTFIVMGLTFFSNGFGGSLKAPFYPPEAEKKGASPTEYGLIFGLCRLAPVISSPLIGKYVEKIGAKFLVLLAICVSGLGMLSLGLMDFVDSHAWFLTLSFIILFVVYIAADTAVMTAVTISTSVFPTTFGTIFAVLEMFTSCGSITGPILGGSIISLLGFMWLFILTGGAIIMFGLSVSCVLPAVNNGNIKAKKQGNIFAVLKLTPVILTSYSIFAHGICTGFIQATLEPHVRQFGLSPVTTGIVFSIGVFVHAIVAPLVGRMCDLKVNPKKIIIFGSLVDIVGFSLMGPLPFLPMKPSLWLVCVGLVMYGVAYSCIVISALLDARHSAVASGLPDDLTTYGIIAGLWASFLSLGNVVGPSVAGILFDWVGFRYATYLIIVIHGILFVVMSCFVCYEQRPRDKDLSASQTHDSSAHSSTNDVTDDDSDESALILIEGKNNDYRSVMPTVDHDNTND